MSQYERHVFVCEGKHCARAGGDDVRDAVKESVDRAGLKRRVRVNRAGCLGQCGHGPMVVVYPEGVWYAGRRPGGGAAHRRGASARRARVSALRYVAPPGDNKDT
jgi:hypothetical protein